MGLVATGLVFGAVLGFAFGLRVVGTGRGGSSPTPSAPVPDVMPDTVSQRLRDAYYSGGGSIAVCLVTNSIVCLRATMSQTARGFADITRSLDQTEMAALTAVRVPAGRIIVAGDFGPVEGAAAARVDPAGPTDARLLVVANPDRQGIDYVDLGDLASGTYLVSIVVPSLHMPTVLIEILVE